MRITLTPNLRERAGQAKNKLPSGARLRHGRNFVDIAFRSWHDQYDFFSPKGEWLATISDASLPSHPQFENISTAPNVKLLIP